MLGCLAWNCHGRQLQTSQKLRSTPLTERSLSASKTLALFLLTSNPGAFKPSTVGWHSPVVSHRHIRQKPALVMQEKRIDAIEGGAFTEEEFREYYGDEKWQEMWDMAKPLGDMKTPDMFKVGDKVKGTVLRLASFGAFVDIGSTCDGLLHISQICDDYISDPKEKLQEGQEIEVTVKEVDVPRQRVGLTCRSAGVGKPLQDLEIGQVVEGKVKRLTSFGAFVDIGAQADALLHVSEASDEFCSDISEKVQEGENIKAMIKELDVERRRIGISCRGMGPPPEEW
mmetsp:Transcript_139679/g.243172  ORF Transcript_139679/g.243172 Transcript_139679/m.243172 type:complete len:284 (-) Transcript_139679:34-885(-)